MKDLKNPRAKRTPAAQARPDPLALRLFGVQVQDLDENLSGAFGYEEGKGVLIADVSKGGPAAEAGLKRGQVIYRVGRFDINSVQEFETLLARAQKGVAADFVIGTVRKVRGQFVQQVTTVTLTAR